MTDPKTQARAYLEAVHNDFAQTQPPSIRGILIRECQEALRILTQPEGIKQEEARP
jgi:hypothetical protein